uniref:Uncharacterized protein n=1 Tax=Tetranychus urticae TaxID=32264 RepID=T1KWE8_TETUR
MFQLIMINPVYFIRVLECQAIVIANYVRIASIKTGFLDSLKYSGIYNSESLLVIEVARKISAANIATVKPSTLSLKRVYLSVFGSVEKLLRVVDL